MAPAKLIFLEPCSGMECHAPAVHPAGTDRSHGSVFDLLMARHDRPGPGLADREGEGREMSHAQMIAFPRANSGPGAGSLEAPGSQGAEIDEFQQRHHRLSVRAFGLNQHTIGYEGCHLLILNDEFLPPDPLDR